MRIELVGLVGLVHNGEWNPEIQPLEISNLKHHTGERERERDREREREREDHRATRKQSVVEKRGRGREKEKGEKKER